RPAPGSQVICLNNCEPTSSSTKVILQPATRMPHSSHHQQQHFIALREIPYLPLLHLFLIHLPITNECFRERPCVHSTWSALKWNLPTTPSAANRHERWNVARLQTPAG